MSDRLVSVIARDTGEVQLDQDKILKKAIRLVGMPHDTAKYLVTDCGCKDRVRYYQRLYEWASLTVARATGGEDSLSPRELEEALKGLDSLVRSK